MEAYHFFLNAGVVYRVSDKVLTQESGFLYLIEPGNVILADRGFTIADDLAVYGAKLEIPAFTLNILSKCQPLEYMWKE